MPWIARLGWVGVVLICGAGAREVAAQASLGATEASYLSWRHDADRVDLLEALGATRTPDGVTAADARRREGRSRAAFSRHLAAAAGAWTGEDSLALAVMRASWNADHDPGDTGAGTPGCPANRSPASLTSAEALARFSAEMMACFQQAANRIVVDGDTVNRLGILGLLARVTDPERRRRLFLALGPVWRSINGDNTPDSPYRRMLVAYATAWAASPSPVETKAPAFGVATPQFESWLERALSRYRLLLPDTLVEPWDWYYLSGEASRRLSVGLPDVASLRRVNDAFFAAIGADPTILNVHYDLDARPGKYPVAYTTFGGRRPVEPWVFASYLFGGFDNLSELLHETGHAVHIAAIRTRPAFLDWPDNDTYTEALADVPALELYEPAWQFRFLGDSMPLAAALRAKYAGIAFDMAWSLFELRAYRDPLLDPNRLWSDLAEQYLGIRPHPEWSWWAMRGQLVDAPGYLLNYALGAFIAADIRAQLAARGESFGNGRIYEELSAELYRQGRSQASREVLQRFLGRAISPEPLLADLDRITR